VNEDFAQLWGQLSPEDRKRLMGLGSLGDENDLLAQQMQQAEALRRGSGVQGYGAAGGALQGAADAVNNIFGAIQQKRAGDEMRANMKQMGDIRGGLFGGLLGGGGGGQGIPYYLRMPGL
jgi:hypothetical protein